MRESVFVRFEFYMLIFVSVILPVCIYGFMMWKKAISRKTVLLFGVVMVAISAVNVVLLQYLAQMAKETPSLLDNRFFASELSVALYILPAVFAGIGVNVISHILIRHLVDAEKQYDKNRR